MDIREKIIELGYHPGKEGDVFFSTLRIYLHGDFVTTLTQMSRQDTWKTDRGVPVDITNIEKRLKLITPNKRFT